MNFSFTACKCNKIGSSRTDCEQMTGRCVCKSGFQGMKCDICSELNNDEQCPTDCKLIHNLRIFFK